MDVSISYEQMMRDRAAGKAPKMAEVDMMAILKRAKGI